MKYPFFNSLKRMWRYYKKTDSDASLRETIEELIEETDEAVPSIESDERQILGNVLDLRDSTAYDIMIPRADIMAISLDSTADDLVSYFVKTGVSWLVVYQKDLDHVVGLIHAKDMLAWAHNKKEFKVRSLLKDVMFISPAMRTLDLLITMRESGTKVAIVVDEYGGVDGLVTFSVLIEEIIGDIEDTDEQAPSHQLQWRSDGTVLADGRSQLEELDKLIGSTLDLVDQEEDIETLGGLVVFLAGRVPLRGELISHPKGIEFEILDADPRRIKRLSIRYLHKHTPRTAINITKKPPMSNSFHLKWSYKSDCS
jgi:CBS domain containing-hemolysin-like protein